MLALNTHKALFEPANVNDPLWMNTTVTSVTTLPTPQGMQVSEYLLSTYHEGEWGRIGVVDVRGWQTRHTLALRLSFESSHNDRQFRGPNHFLDRVAVFFPSDENTLFMTMGSAQSPGTIWSWRADGNTEKLLAQGPGTITPLSNEGLRSESHHDGKRWHVLLCGPQIKSQPRKFAVAVWSGAHSERAGLKAFSHDWIQLDAL